MTTRPVHIGHTKPYRAANGHMMIAPLYRTANGDEMSISAHAQCVPDCSACAEGDWLPDY